MIAPRMISVHRDLHHVVRALLIVALAATATSASEIVLQNDSVPQTGSGNPLLAFLPNEQAATWHVAPAAGNIVGVQVQWDSLVGTNTGALELFVNVYLGGTFPTPGALAAQVVGPSLNDGSNNEMRHLNPPTNTIPLNVPVTAGQTVVVALEFANASNPAPFGSGVEIDQDGIQLGKNSIFAQPGGWAAAGPVGVTGDFGIRAVFAFVPEPTSAALLYGCLAALCLSRQRRRR